MLPQSARSRVAQIGNAAEDPAIAHLVRDDIVTDAADLGSKWSGWSQEYVQLGAGRFEGRFRALACGRVHLLRETHDRSLQQFGRAPQDSRHFNVQLSTHERDGAFFCGTPVRRYHVLALSEGGEFSFRTPERSDCVTITIDDALLAEFRERRDAPLLTPAKLDHTIELEPAAYDALTALLRTIFYRYDAAAPQAREQLRRRFERQLVHALVEADARAVRERERRQNYRRDALLRRSQAYLDEHQDEAIMVADLCEALGVSRRTVQSLFVEAYGRSAVRYLLALRLNRARRMLRGGLTDANSIADIAAAYGFWHPSYFSAAYKRMFGELPSQTANG